MKTFISFIIASALLAYSVPEYHIHGHISDIEDGTKLYLQQVGPPAQSLDSTIVKNGTFEFKGKAPVSAQWSLLSLKGKFLAVADFYLEEGDISVSGKAYNCIVEGTRTNNEYRVYNHNLSPLYDKQVRFYTDLAINYPKGIAYRDSMNRGIKLVNRKVDEAEVNYIRTYPASPLSLRILSYKSGHVTGQRLDSIIALLDKSFQNLPEVLKLKQYAKQLISSAEGTLAPDFSLIASNGQKFSLSEKKGKYLLIDFWASWCAPCRAALPEIARLNEKYKNKNLEIIGVSLDRNTESWKKALMEDKPAWTQFCDSSGKIAKLYAVSGIPLTILISPDGKIISRGLQKNDLADKLIQVIGN